MKITEKVSLGVLQHPTNQVSSENIERKKLTKDFADS